MYTISADDPKHVALRHRNGGKWFPDESWARWAPVEMVIENVRDDHVDSSGKGTSCRWLPLCHDNMSTVELTCLTKALIKTQTATQGVFATEAPAVNGWVSGTAERSQDQVPQRQGDVDNSIGKAGSSNTNSQPSTQHNQLGGRVASAATTGCAPSPFVCLRIHFVALPYGLPCA